MNFVFDPTDFLPAETLDGQIRHKEVSEL